MGGSPSSNGDEARVPGSVPVRPVLWTLTGLALAHLLLVLASLGAGDGSALSFTRAVLSCLILPMAGLPLALLVLQGRAKSGDVGARPLGAFALAAISLGASLVVHYVVCFVVRAVNPPVTDLQLSLTALAGVGLSFSLVRRRFIHPEPGLSGQALVLALVVALAFAVVARHRLFGGLGRLVASDKHIDALLNKDEIARPGHARVVPGRGLTHLGQHRYRVAASPAYFAVRNETGRRDMKARLALMLTAPLRSGVQLWQVPNRRCKLAAQTGREEKLVTSPVVPHEQAPPFTPHSALLSAMVPLDSAAGCYELRLTGGHADRPGSHLIADLSHEDLSGGITADGRFTFLSSGGVECHFSDANYRRSMLDSNVISPNLQLWGYFLPFLAEVLAGGTYPLIGVLFLFLALLCYAAVQVIMGGPVKSGAPPDPPLDRRLAGVLLVGPFLCHLISLVYIGTQSFAFPDSAYTFLLLGALAMLMQRRRVGFILLGCLAAYARLPGGYVLAVILFAWLVFAAGDRRWVLRTLLWSVAAGVGFIGLLLLFFAVHSSIGDLFQAVYGEVYLEHFSGHDDVLPVWSRRWRFFVKLGWLSSLTLLLWPLALRRGYRVSKLLMVVTLGYAATMMSVVIPHNHYFIMLSYCAAGAGVGALARTRNRYLAAAAVVLVIAGVVLTSRFFEI